VNSRQALGIGVVLTLLVAMEGRLTAGASSRREGLAAWHQMYSVLSHPRCINCHTATNYPEQGDDRHHHLFNVVRGQQDHGVPAITITSTRGRLVGYSATPASHHRPDPRRGRRDVSARLTRHPLRATSVSINWRKTAIQRRT